MESAVQTSHSFAERLHNGSWRNGQLSELGKTYRDTFSSHLQDSIKASPDLQSLLPNGKTLVTHEEGRPERFSAGTFSADGTSFCQNINLN